MKASMVEGKSGNRSKDGFPFLFAVVAAGPPCAAARGGWAGKPNRSENQDFAAKHL